jgi:RimJ/RimL family protein N-acetyltransferase
LPPLADLELLAIQAEASLDSSGRIAGVYGVTIACTTDGQALWIGTEVPERLAAELRAVFDGAGPSSDPAQPPPALEPCRHLLEAGSSSMRLKAGPSLLIPDDVQFASEVHIERSDVFDGGALRNANPGNWHAIEWDELLDGRLGAWAIALAGERAVSICHTPGPITPRGAECGVWTLQEVRGRGYAAAVTAAWAGIMRRSGRYLFYSTDAENVSSQRVARRLDLRPIGWTWKLRPASQPDRNDFHPLSSLQRRHDGSTA